MEYIIGLVLLLGGLIFIHELGHFLFAKLYGVRVDTFSIGMGKKIWTHQRGETEYALSIFPLGGYVKLLGQDPREEIPAELEHRSFRAKPLYQRSAIVLAGPIFNAVLAVLIFIGLYTAGVPTAAPTLNRVLPESPAAVAGFNNGDTVVSISKAGTSYKIREWSDFEKIVGQNEGNELVFEVKSKDGATKNISYTPVLGSVRDSMTGIMKSQGVIAGVENNLPAPVIHVEKNSWASERQLPSAFWVKEIHFSNGGLDQQQKVESFADLEKYWSEIISSSESSERGQITFKGFSVLPGNENTKTTKESSDQSFTMAWSRLNDAPSESLAANGVYSAELVISEIIPEKPAEKWGLVAGDRITRIDGKTIHSFQSFRENVQNLAVKNKTIHLTWVRDGKEMTADLSPQMGPMTDPLTEVKKDQYQIGAAFFALQAPPSMTTLKAEGVVDAVSLGVAKTWMLTKSMVGSFYYLLSGQVSPKTLGGPILIGKIAGDSFRDGVIPFFRMMAFISLNLFVLNLMPIPVLDGGHLVLFAIEAVTRKPVSIKAIEIWTTAGFLFLMGIFAIVMFNDISRLGVFKLFS